MDTRPIGIFDSGIGGLTVANALRKLLPHESMVYFGDTAHLPYGDKSPDLIRHYSARIAHFLLQHNCKMVVIACNTASSHAHQTVAAVAGPTIPVVNVIDPVVQEIALRHASQKIGIIGTKGTIDSRVYPNRIKKLISGAKVCSLATPLLAPMIEEGFISHTISKTVINSYLEKPTLKGVEAIVLGCTHYPLIRREVAAYYGEKVTILDSTTLVAMEVRQLLASKDLAAGDQHEPTFHFMVSDKTESFERSTRLFFKERVSLEEIKMWDDPRPL
ncbi:MAG: glutamate racemase [Flavobacteriales bacterium]|jgi:glutamate racemase